MMSSGLAARPSAFRLAAFALTVACCLSGWTTLGAQEDSTPVSLVGVVVVDASTVAAMAARGEARLVDTRALHDFLGGHLPEAYHVDYRERSARSPDFKASEDEPAAFLARLRKFVAPDQAVVFYCNGASCWKSYKAAAVSREAGYRSVYWFRGGMLDWQRLGGPVIRE